MFRNRQLRQLMMNQLGDHGIGRATTGERVAQSRARGAADLVVSNAGFARIEVIRFGVQGVACMWAHILHLKSHNIPRGQAERCCDVQPYAGRADMSRPQDVRRAWHARDQDVSCSHCAEEGPRGKQPFHLLQ